MKEIFGKLELNERKIPITFENMAALAVRGKNVQGSLMRGF